jgi:hypothetical protein
VNSPAGIGGTPDGQESVLLLGVRALDKSGDCVTSVVRNQVRYRDSDGVCGGSACLG